MQKQTCFNKKIQHNLKLKKYIIIELLNNIKKFSLIYFLFNVGKKLHESKEKNLKALGPATQH
jgi:hypothetical protein